MTDFGGLPFRESPIWVCMRQESFSSGSGPAVNIHGVSRTKSGTPSNMLKCFSMYMHIYIYMYMFIVIYISWGYLGQILGRCTICSKSRVLFAPYVLNAKFPMPDKENVVATNLIWLRDASSTNSNRRAVLQKTGVCRVSSMRK